MWLKCKVIKKVAIPHFYITTLFLFIPLSSKKFDTPLPQVTQFAEGHILPLTTEGGGGGRGLQLCCWEVGIWRGVILSIWTFVIAKSNILDILIIK